MTYIGLDLGGTLSKMCFIAQDDSIPYSESTVVGACTIRFRLFTHASDCFAFIAQYFTAFQIAVTGGGGFKYKAQLQALSPSILTINQFDSLVEGLRFLAKQKKPVRTLQVGLEGQCQHASQHIESLFPYLLVNIGSGVSMLLVQADYSYSRVGGTSLGGGFFMGLCKVLLGEDSFQKALFQMSSQGGQGLNLQAGRDLLLRQIHDLTFLNICQLVTLSSINCNAKNIIFTGSFTRQNAFLTDCFVRSIRNFNADNEQKIVRKFVSLQSKDGYLGALGTLCCLKK